MITSDRSHSTRLSSFVGAVYLLNDPVYVVASIQYLLVGRASTRFFGTDRGSMDPLY